jgi:hypothetical protein
VIEGEGRIAGSGGGASGRRCSAAITRQVAKARLLDPKTEAARVRAMYTHPDFTRAASAGWCWRCARRRGARRGFARVELAATMAGLPLYRACGYAEIEAFESDTPSGVKVPLVRMGKHIALSPAGGEGSG